MIDAWLPCPECGGPVEIQTWRSCRAHRWVGTCECFEDGECRGIYVEGPTLEQVRAGWNAMVEAAVCQAPQGTPQREGA